MKPTLILAAACVALIGLTARADTKDKLLHAILVEETDGDAVTTFSSDTPKIYALWKSDTVKEGEKVRSVWIADDVGEVAPRNTKIDEATVTATGDKGGTFSLSKPDKGWPAGQYHLDLYVGDKLAETLKFTITDDEDEEND